jgi:hypothetical protein
MILNRRDLDSDTQRKIMGGNAAKLLNIV